MKLLKLLLTVILFLSLNNLWAQHSFDKTKCVIKIEAENGNKIKSGEGYFFVLNLAEEKSQDMLYSVILVKKSLLVGATTLKLYFARKDDVPLVVSIPYNNEYTIQHPDKNIDLVTIPLGHLKKQLENQNLGESIIYYVEEDVPNVFKGIQSTDLESIKKLMKS